MLNYNNNTPSPVAASPTGVQQHTVQSTTNNSTILTTKEKEEYLKGKRFRVITNAINTCGSEIPEDMIIDLNYNWKRAIDRVKEDQIKRINPYGY